MEIGGAWPPMGLGPDVCRHAAIAITEGARAAREPRRQRAIVAEAKTLLTALTQAPFVRRAREQLVKAEEAMRKWYLEWSQIARVAIKQRALLKELGFLNTRKGREEEPENCSGCPTTAPSTTTPAATTPPATPTTTTPAASAVSR